MKKTITFRGNIDWRSPERRKYLGNGGHARAASAPAKNSSARRVRVLRSARAHAERWDPMIPTACVACKIQNKFVLACSPDVDIGKRYRLAFCRHHGVCNTGAPLLHGVKKKRPMPTLTRNFNMAARTMGARRPTKAKGFRKQCSAIANTSSLVARRPNAGAVEGSRTPIATGISSAGPSVDECA